MDLRLLETLTQTFGPSGYEDDIRSVILKSVEAFAHVGRLDAQINVHRQREAQGTVWRHGCGQRTAGLGVFPGQKADIAFTIGGVISGLSRLGSAGGIGRRRGGGDPEPRNRKERLGQAP